VTEHYALADRIAELVAAVRRQAMNDAMDAVHLYYCSCKDYPQRHDHPRKRCSSVWVYEVCIREAFADAEQERASP
jgi:hypothetical protein